MPVSFRHVALVIVALLGASPQARAEEDAALQSFAEPFIAAVNGKDPATMKAMIHSASLACLTGDNEPFLADTIAGAFSRNIPAGRSIAEQAIPANVQLLADRLFPDKFTYPVRPTRVIRIEYISAARATVALMQEVALDGDAWKQVLPCPKEGTLAWMKEAREAKAKRDAEQAAAVDALLARMTPAQQADMVAMAKGGKPQEAVAKLQADMQVDEAIAYLTVKKLFQQDAAAPAKP